ncbi:MULTISPECIES: fructosamine kinase family protein [Gordonia]|uniref:Fructosamine kinase family protein n=1 Tax=Gordonia hongkongensis TaxID=1701090 RepID=A0ABT6BZT4_9ACTN|nr:MULTISPECIES: fructosamine kinase family protein [Gordonia]MBN0972850.1 fructosamine kinase family protein [Gordonia sp. BP-119]MBN0983072.1 fructosamine kinase family protein [Gordonia sp. BP-94]MDF6103438.1 fructosamine kinase family protein [Gordonia hongkongensis]UCZ91550.1 fructosamine kinase family protein [Gordonia sp. WA4-43]
MSPAFTKTLRQSGPRGGHPDFFAAEAAGLRWLSASGAPVVQVISVSEDAIELERLERGRPSPGAAREFGVALARMHDGGAPQFGSPPADADGTPFSGQLFIGRRELSSVEYRSWGEFYVRERVEPYLAPARAAGNLTTEDEDAVRDACALIADGVFDDDEGPARIHGDLWNGNVMWTPRGVVMIDPAAHGGHRETDLAMLALFGCPHLDAVLDGYRDAHPLVPGWQERVDVHQLHPLAVHAAGHGPGYGSSLGRAARASAALARG